MSRKIKKISFPFLIFFNVVLTLVTKSTYIGVICDIGVPEYGQNVHSTRHVMLYNGIPFRFDHTDLHNNFGFGGNVYTFFCKEDSDNIKSTLIMYNRLKLVEFEVSRLGPPFESRPDICMFNIKEGSLKVAPLAKQDLINAVGKPNVQIGLKNFEKSPLLIEVKGKWCPKANLINSEQKLSDEDIANVLKNRGFSQPSIDRFLKPNISAFVAPSYKSVVLLIQVLMIGYRNLSYVTCISKKFLKMKACFYGQYCELCGTNHGFIPIVTYLH